MSGATALRPARACPATKINLPDARKASEMHTARHVLSGKTHNVPCWGNYTFRLVANAGNVEERIVHTAELVAMPSPPPGARREVSSLSKYGEKSLKYCGPAMSFCTATFRAGSGKHPDSEKSAKRTTNKFPRIARVHFSDWLRAAPF